jgi:hypothetical protein
VDFVQALSEVSWEEIQSSGQSENPRLFSIRKLVEICYYNMNRIRLEWVNVWAILGEHFNQVTSFSVFQIYTQPRTGLLPQQCSCQQLCVRLSEAARHALPRKGGTPQFQISKGFLKAIPAYYDAQYKPRIEGYGLFVTSDIHGFLNYNLGTTMSSTNDSSTGSQSKIWMENDVRCLFGCLQGS